MRLTFIRKGLDSANNTAKFFVTLFIFGQDFLKLCNAVGIDVTCMYFHKLSFGSVDRLVHKHFSDSCLV